MAEENKPDGTNIPPFETEDLRTNLARFLDSTIDDPVAGTKRPVGNFRWCVYISCGYDGEPIHLWQTNERLRSRIRSRLTNQRTDAVPTSVFNPFEIFEIEVYPLAQF